MVSGAMFSGIGWQHHALGWVFTYLIHSTVLIGVVWGITRAIPRLSLDTKETMWRVALFGGLLTSVVQCAFALDPLPGNLDLPQAMVAQRDKDAPAPVTVAAAPEEEVLERRVVEHRNGELTITTVRERKPAAMVAAASAPMEASRWPWIILALIGAGSVFALGRLAWAARKLAKQLEGRRDVIEDPVLETHLALCAKAELKKRPRLSASSKLRSPMALLRGEICMPERAVDSLTPQQQQAMLAHELAHLIRRDPAWRIVIAAFEALFFFQPLNHFARRKLNEVAEFQCDDWAAANTGSGVHLAKCLAEVASWLDGGPQETAIMTAMAVPSSPIVQRITRLLGHPSAQASGHTAVRVAFTVFALGAVTWLVPGVGYASPSSKNATPAKLASADAQGVHFVDASDPTHDRSTLHIDTGEERVEVHVESPKAPPQVVVEDVIEPPARGDSLQIIIQGGVHGGGFPFCGHCGGGWYFGLEMLDGMGGLEALIDGAIEDELEDLLEGEVNIELHGWHGGGRHRSHHDVDAHLQRARAHAERAQAAAERARAHAERARAHQDGSGLFDL